MARQFVALTLEKEGYQILQARDGREAIQQLQQSPQIQAVFCDVEMPTTFDRSILKVLAKTQR